MKTASTTLSRVIAVGIDTARYGHHVTFLRDDRQPAARPLPITENRQGYRRLQDTLQELFQRHPQAEFRFERQRVLPQLHLEFPGQAIHLAAAGLLDRLGDRAGLDAGKQPIGPIHVAERAGFDSPRRVEGIKSLGDSSDG